MHVHLKTHMQPGKSIGLQLNLADNSPTDHSWQHEANHLLEHELEHELESMSSCTTNPFVLSTRNFGGNTHDATHSLRQGGLGHKETLPRL